MKKQLESSRGNDRGLGTKEGRSKGGSITKTDSIKRQANVERLMRMGLGVTNIASRIVDGKKLGTYDTISKDIEIIRSRWLKNDIPYFHRASVARIEAKERLLEQMVRIGGYILKLISNKKKNDAKTIIYAESLLTTVISRIYEVDADLDPEQYLDQKIQNALKNKIQGGLKHEIKESTPTIS